MLERIFHVRAAGSTPGREALGGVTTFLTMAYILAVNPVFLTAAGMPQQGAIVATALSARPSRRCSWPSWPTTRSPWRRGWG